VTRRTHDLCIEIPGRTIGLPMLQHVSLVQSHYAVRNTWHAHLGFEVIFLLNGATGYEFEYHETVELHGGHFLVIPPRTVHRGLHDVRAPCTLCGLAFNTSQPTAWKNTPFTLPDIVRLFAALHKAVRQAHPLDAPLRWVVGRLMAQLAGFPATAHRPGAQAALRALVCFLLAEATRLLQVPPRVPMKYISTAVAYLQKHLQEPVYITDLVRYMGFGRTRLFEMFKAETGHTPNEYLQRLRIERAMEMLRQTRRSLTDVALATGFGSGQYFSESFRRYTGVAPNDYRRGDSPRRRMSKYPTKGQ
jgi:AraC-like DNA-binding protein